MATRWTKAQTDAIHARNCNLLVAAAAGAGKTAVLVERIIQKITDPLNPMDLDQLLVMTFTNAAAAEMRERIAQAIARQLEQQPGNRMIQKQLTLLNKASITTIHSFCLEVIRSNFHQIDLDPGFRISDQTEAELMKIEVLDTLFEEIYERESADSTFYELLECYAGNRDDRRLQEMVLNLFNFSQSSPRPNAWLREISGYFLIPKGVDFARTAWGKVLLNAVKLEFEGMENKMAAAVQMLRTFGPDKYLPVFEEELASLQRIVRFFEQTEDPGWDETYRIAGRLTFQKLPAAGKDADKQVQEKVKEIRDEVKKCYAKTIDQILSLSSAEIADSLRSLYPVINCLTAIVMEFARRYADKKREKSLLDFNDLEHLCLKILTAEGDEAKAGEDGAVQFSPSKVALGYKQRFAEILVDEYQDSNLVQEIIIKMISREDLSDPNVFMVGDVKQSIYRFRQAKPELFLNKYLSYSTQADSRKRKILLSQNFRSREEIIEMVNFIFERIMSEKAGELDYTQEEFLYPGAVFPPVDSERLYAGGKLEFHLVVTQDGNSAARALGEERNGQAEEGDGFSVRDSLGEGGSLSEVGSFSERGNLGEGDGAGDGDSSGEGDYRSEEEMLDDIQLEARLVAKRIRELMTADQQGRRFVVFDRQLNEYRPVEYRDIVILLRTTKNWAEIFAEEFARQGIPAYADTNAGFFKTPEVQVILSLLQIIDNPLQDIPLLAVLRSPLFSFSTEELTAIRLTKRQGLFYDAVRESDHPKAVSFMEKLRKWREEAQYLSTDRLIWKIYSETGFYGNAGALPGGEQRQANLRMLFEKARKYEETSYKGLFNFIRFIDKLKVSQGDFGSAKTLGENENVVRIMSIHKSKGLEFPVVFLSGCGKKMNFQDLHKSVLFHETLGLGPDIVDCKLRISYPSMAKLAIKEKIRTETLAEEMRILYVALTRAKEKLILTGNVKDIGRCEQKWLKLSAGGGRKPFPAYHILRAERYLDWLGAALMTHPEWKTICHVWERHMVSEAGQERTQIELDDDDWLQRVLDERCTESKSIKEGAGEDSSETHYRRQEINRRLDWEYPYRRISKIPAKISVTELKRFTDRQGDDAADIGMPLQTYLMKKPLFLEGKQGFSAAEKGTLMHFAMQHFDLTNEDLATQLQQMVEKDLMTREQAECIDLKLIRDFCASPLGRRMITSGSLKREIPFHMELKCGEIFEDLADEQDREETVVLQGIIDCCFEEADGLVLIDYKTDYTIPGQGEKMKEKYSRQIYYYALALERLTGKKVKEKYLYLFSTGETIPL